MPSVFDFDSALRERLEPKFGTLGLVARHKLLYAVQRLSISKTGEPAFHARCEAWKMGPVFTEFYAAVQANPRVTGDPSILTAQENEFCDLVGRLLGAQSGRSLAARSHWRYAEWFEAKKRRTNKEITVNAIREQLELFKPKV